MCPCCCSKQLIEDGAMDVTGMFWAQAPLLYMGAMEVWGFLAASELRDSAFSSRSVMYSWTQVSLGLAQNCRFLLVRKLQREVRVKKLKHPKTSFGRV